LPATSQSGARGVGFVNDFSTHLLGTAAPSPPRRLAIIPILTPLTILQQKLNLLLFSVLRRTLRYALLIELQALGTRALLIGLRLNSGCWLLETGGWKKPATSNQ
jgi:hypothetical protein